MGCKCFVPYCDSGNSTCKKKYSMFACKNIRLIRKWEEAIARADRRFARNDRVCEKHFKAEDIIREWVALDGITKIPLKLPRLRPTAVPSRYLGCPKCAPDDTSTKSFSYKRVVGGKEHACSGDVFSEPKRRKVDIFEPSNQTTINDASSSEDSNFSVVFVKTELEDPLRVDTSDTNDVCMVKDEVEVDIEPVRVEPSAHIKDVTAFVAEVTELRTEVKRLNSVIEKLKQELLQSRQNEAKLQQIVTSVRDIVNKDVLTMAVNVKQEILK